jgi:hypothetical protein
MRKCFQGPFFYQGTPKTLKEYCKIIVRAFRELLGEIQFEKKWRENKMGGNKAFIEWRGGV